MTALFDGLRQPPTWPILTGEFARKRLATMASRSSPPPRKAIKLEDFARELAERRAALGEIDMPRNSGLRRTESKKALLAAIKAAGGKW